MAERHRADRIAGNRQPLSELSNRANTPRVHHLQQKRSKAANDSPKSLPHNESLVPNGSLAVRSSQPSSPEHRRLAQVVTEDGKESKRNSAISTASTTASGRKRKTYIGHWQLGKTIGKGGCSRVRAVRNRYTMQYGAVKIIARSTAESTRAQSLANLIESRRNNSSPVTTGVKPIPYGLEREIAVMRLLEHENIVQLFDVWENSNELYLIMEYVDGGELFHYVESRRGLPEDETIYIFRQIVAALLYCHRLHICHRDLKPENILLNQDTLTVKLIDFGMAALQPQGRQLSTPCGSPHYAAPEVVSAKPYDGKQADVWSCGVILYVMLTGTTPYNYSPDGDIRALFRDITRAKFFMPPELSFEAKDLIKRIFVADPKRRITMDAVWDHPLMHKYDKTFGLLGPAGSKEAAIGPVPKLEDWTVKHADDIDPEILRNMRTLWHSEPEKNLMQKLINRDINQEKIFYAALVKHRDENLENYVGDSDNMSCSASDYHHGHIPNPQAAPPLPLDRQQRSQSQYSIMNDEHLRPSHSFTAPPSVSSYDPYRASRDPISHQGEYVNVIVHRDSSGSRQASRNRSLRQPNSLRVDMLKHASRHGSSTYSSSSLTRSGTSRHSIRRSSVSHHSLTGSNWPSSPPIIATMRPSDVHKRGVTFGHVRRTSTMSALTSQNSVKATTPATPKLPDAGPPQQRSKKLAKNLQGPTVSPTVHVQQVIRSRKEKPVLLETPRIKAKKPIDTPGYQMRSDIRKHSIELEKACQEAFFRDSVGSGLTAHSNTTDKQTPYDTPPSSISRHSATFDKLLQLPSPRPLPDLPSDTPNTYLQRTLGEAREKLAAYKAGGEDNTAKFDEVMRMLEDIIPANSPGRRLTSAPEARTPDHLGGFLPAISEESDQRNSKDGAGNWRSVTVPVSHTRQHRERAEREVDDKTVRIVPPSSPGTVAPLNVRKRSNGSEVSHEPRHHLRALQSQERLGRKATPETPSSLAPIEEDKILPLQHVLRKKKSGWFGLARKAPDPDLIPSRADTPTALLDLDGRTKRRSNVLRMPYKPEKPLPVEPPGSALSSEFPIRKKRFGSGKKGFSKWLGRVGRSGGEQEEGDTAVTAAVPNNSLDSLFSSASPAPSVSGPIALTGTERSWFARFLNIKPASKTLCLSIPRGRARQELVLLLKEWQRHGIRDLEYSREQNTIVARVDKVNSLDIKPVAFRVEIFVVLEHGKKVGLSIARFVQVKGAASGFKKVLEVIDGVMRGRGWLVEDEEKWKALCEVIGG